MKIGDIIKVVDNHHSNPGMIGLILEDFGKTPHNKGKAWKVFLANGKIRTKMAKHLENNLAQEELLNLKQMGMEANLLKI